MAQYSTRRRAGVLFKDHTTTQPRAFIIMSHESHDQKKLALPSLAGIICIMTRQSGGPTTQTRRQRSFFLPFQVDPPSFSHSTTALATFTAAERESVSACMLGEFESFEGDGGLSSRISPNLRVILCPQPHSALLLPPVLPRFPCCTRDCHSLFGITSICEAAEPCFIKSAAISDRNYK